MIEHEPTHPEEDSVVNAARMRLWLQWVFPRRAAIALEHGAVFGRETGCSIAVDGAAVSRRHAEVYRQGPLFAIKDLSSTNGTYLGGKRIQHAPLSSGSVLRIGENVGVLIESEDSPVEFSEIAPGFFAGHEVQLAMNPVRRAATSDIPIVVVGRTGTGKERVARAIHQLSGRTGAFHAINCAALPVDLAEAELFGYRKGSFTGADRASIGHFRAADRGTLFLDEIAELPLPLQSKLLRAIQEGVVTQLGESEEIAIDVRVLAATQEPLERSVSNRRFREDLRARLEGLVVELPTLRERRGDIVPLFLHFVDRYSRSRNARLEARLIESLCLQDWPMNVRQLELATRHLLALHGTEPVLRRSFLPGAMTSLTANEDLDPIRGEAQERREYDEQRLARALRQTQGNVASAASLLGFSRQRAYRLLDGKSPAAFADVQPPDQAHSR